MSAEHVLGARLREWLAVHNDELVAFRREMHAHPELSGREHATTARIVERLDVAGLQPRVLRSGTGVVCDIGEADGPMVALRGDIDALAMNDETGTHFASQVPGVAHACGHDVHTTVLLGAGLYLHEVSRHLGGRVRLIFQPSEESLPGGAREVIAEGELAGVNAIVGVHCEPKLPSGTVALRRGPITSASDMLSIRLRGPGGHTARPELTVNLIAVVGTLITELPHRIAKAVADLGPVKVVFGAVRSGDAGNVIPTEARLRATVRTPSITAWEELPEVVERLTRECVEGTGAEISVRYVHGVPPVHNDADVTRTVARGLAHELAGHPIEEAPQSWGGDDFAWFTREVPGTYVRLGTHDEAGGGPMLDLHAGHFDVDENAIGVGVRMFVAGAYQLLAEARP